MLSDYEDKPSKASGFESKTLERVTIWKQNLQCVSFCGELLTRRQILNWRLMKNFSRELLLSKIRFLTLSILDKLLFLQFPFFFQKPDFYVQFLTKLKVLNQISHSPPYFEPKNKKQFWKLIIIFTSCIVFDENNSLLVRL